MAKTKAQKQKNYIECLKTKDRATFLESERKQKKKKLEQIKKDKAAYNFSLQKNRLRKAVEKVVFHLVDKLKAGHKASTSQLDEVKNQLTFQAFISLVLVTST